MKQGLSHLPPFEDFQDKFRQAFGRELTREERRFYRLLNIVLEEDFATSTAEQSKREFIHTFNNLLHVLVGHVELLGRVVEDDPEALQHITQIRQAASDASSLTRHLVACDRKHSKRSVTSDVFNDAETVPA